MGREAHFGPSWTLHMPQTPTAKLKPYQEVRAFFSEGRREQLRTQGPITQKAIRTIQQSRKYARSPASAMSRA